MDGAVKKYVKKIEWIRDRLKHMDSYINPIMGVGDWDDSVCVEFKGRLLASTDGPYSKRLVLKSALIHAATDVVVKGGRPVFALDNLIGSEADVEEMIESLRKQAEAMEIPILGGNTLIEDTEPLASVTVVGRLITDEPIRDSGAEKGDVVALVGEPIWGEQGERISKAKLLFNTWYDALDKVKFNSSKDVTKGGIKSAVYEMECKSRLKFRLHGGLPYHIGRNLDNFIVTLTEYEYVNLERVCVRHGCRLTRIGVVE